MELGAKPVFQVTTLCIVCSMTEKTPIIASEGLEKVKGGPLVHRCAVGSEDAVRQ